MPPNVMLYLRDPLNAERIQDINALLRCLSADLTFTAGRPPSMIGSEWEVGLIHQDAGGTVTPVFVNVESGQEWEEGDLQLFEQAFGYTPQAQLNCYVMVRGLHAHDLLGSVVLVLADALDAHIRLGIPSLRSWPGHLTHLGHAPTDRHRGRIQIADAEYFRWYVESGQVYLGD